jgi:predicted lipoprotein with Yx(FWY)xxD motif
MTRIGTPGWAWTALVAAMLVVVPNVGAAQSTSRGGADGKGRGSGALGTLSTPVGITLQALGRGQGWDLGKETASIVYRDEVAYADARGRTLYTHENDAPGRSNCTGECAEKFRPAVPVPGAQPLGKWTIFAREDGTRQWALDGRPLYTFADDADPGSVFGNSAARYGAKRKDGFGNIVGGGRRGSGVRGASGEKPAPSGWKTALLHPVRGGVSPPPGLRFAEVLDAAAVTLVDHRGHTVYAYDGDASAEAAAVAKGGWRPVAAPAIAVPLGDFAAHARDDGRTQWTWQGRRLYTFDQDARAGDATGVGNGWNVAALHRHFVPDGVTRQRTASQGLVWANAQGLTLYKRDGHIYQSGGGRSLHRGAPQRPAVGRDISVNARCEGECLRDWQPFVAPKDAQPRGYWDVYTRPDGARQWAYQGYALWTYAGDKSPGDMYGHDTYDMYFAMDAGTRVDVGTPMDGIATLVWAVAFP